MPILLKEYVGYDPKSKKDSTSLNNFKESKEPIPKELKEWQLNNPDKFFSVKFEAIHADIPTANFTRYLYKGLEESTTSWTNPYKIPVIMYHNDYDGEVVGRVISASMGQGERNSSAKCLYLNAKIPGWITQHNIQEGILDTVSVGMSGTDVRCSICNSKISDGEFCEHIKGYTYNGKICYWDVYEATAKEISFVIVPSDKYAGVVSWYDPYQEEYKCNTTIKAPHPTPILLTTSENENKKNSQGITIQESYQNNNTTKKETIILDLKEAEKEISSLKTANQALSGDKASLQKNIDILNNEKIKLQESIKDLEAQIETKDLDFTNEKSLREAAEKKIEDLTKEIKNSLVDAFIQLRENAGKPKIENVENRSIESLRDSIADLKMELKESQEKNKEQNEQTKITEIKNTVDNVSLVEGENKPNKNKENVVSTTKETFEL